jgi:hypothetical protein
MIDKNTFFLNSKVIPGGAQSGAHSRIDSDEKNSSSINNNSRENSKTNLKGHLRELKAGHP